MFPWYVGEHKAKKRKDQKQIILLTNKRETWKAVDKKNVLSFAFSFSFFFIGKGNGLLSKEKAELQETKQK